MAFIYLIESDNDFEKIYKIGFTRNNVKKRLKTLKTGNPSRLSIKDKFETKHNRKIESALHIIYSNKRVDGEWFKLDNYDIDNFMINCLKLEKNFDILVESDNAFYKK